MTDPKRTHDGRHVTLGLQAGPVTSSTDWLATCRAAEQLGFDALYVADHPGVTASPFALLAAAASVTEHLRLGTYVLNAGVRDVIEIASGAATIDMLSHGRMVLGLGAGHTPTEWTAIGRPYPAAAERVARLREVVETVEMLLNGEVVTTRGDQLSTRDAFLLAPRPHQTKIPLLVGGNGLDLLRLAGRSADIVSLTGLGRTLPDGHQHIAEWSNDAIERRITVVRESAADADAAPVLNALVQHVEITDHADDAARRLADTVPGLTPEQVLTAPYALIGTLDEIADQLDAHRDRWSFTSYTVRADATDQAAAILRHLRTR